MPDHFDMLARLYDRMAGPLPLEALIHLRSGLNLRPGQRLADVGGGTGRFAQVLAADGVRVVVCDRSRGMLAQARAKDLPGLQSSVDGLPLASDSVDAVMVVDAFHHFTRPSASTTQPAAARELLRVVRSGGRLLIAEPDIRQRPVRWIALFEKMMLMHSRMLDAATMAGIFSAAGGEMVAETVMGYNVALLFVKR